ncbi:anti-sigma factor [Roseateles amylovorans]|uniref:Anti-sigma factor n=1 Tax=Roseateles amylovorans TaxID=2978473 RepID=A0ABY6B4I2_9BURK|nr:anti-sigma factor [Roseateles amylovorans]UXH79440.1 anti-sigma factor [Roseateles amylovorans]
MDYGHPERAQRLAAEYALGTLRGGARRRFERLLPAHPALSAAVADWLARLQLLAGQVEPVTPPDSVWTAVQSRLFGAAPGTRVAANDEPSTSARWWARVGPWRGFSAAASVAALTLAVLVMQPVPVAPPVVVVLHSTPDGAAVLKTGFVASVTADGQALVLRPLAPVTIDAQHALELWAVPKGGAPRSLGLIQAGDASTTIVRTGLLRDTHAFAVSLEPVGGSRTGAPTGPILSAGEV